MADAIANGARADQQRAHGLPEVGGNFDIDGFRRQTRVMIARLIAEPPGENNEPGNLRPDRGRDGEVVRENAERFFRKFVFFFPRLWKLYRNRLHRFRVPSKPQRNQIGVVRLVRIQVVAALQAQAGFELRALAALARKSRCWGNFQDVILGRQQ